MSTCIRACIRAHLYVNTHKPTFLLTVCMYIHTACLPTNMATYQHTCKHSHRNKVQIWATHSVTLALSYDHTLTLCHKRKHTQTHTHTHTHAHTYKRARTHTHCENLIYFSDKLLEIPLHPPTSLRHLPPLPFKLVYLNPFTSTYCFF